MGVLHQYDVQGVTDSTERSLSSDLRKLLARRRMQLATTLVLAAFVPILLRGLFLPGDALEPASVNTFLANVAAVAFAFWLRLSMETYPGVRRAYLILLTASTAHAAALVWFLFTRLPYDR